MQNPLHAQQRVITYFGKAEILAPTENPIGFGYAKPFTFTVVGAISDRQFRHKLTFFQNRIDIALILWYNVCAQQN